MMRIKYKPRVDRRSGKEMSGILESVRDFSIRFPHSIFRIYLNMNNMIYQIYSVKSDAIVEEGGPYKSKVCLMRAARNAMGKRVPLKHEPKPWKSYSRGRFKDRKSPEQLEELKRKATPQNDE